MNLRIKRAPATRDILRDGGVLEQARRDAFALVARSQAPGNDRLRAELMVSWGGRLEL